MAQHRALAVEGSDAPLILAIESATARASVALLRGERVLGQRASEAGQHHSERLLPMLDALLGELETSLDAVEAFAISIGPGAFTSLRIGLATLKGLAFSADRPVVPVSTLEVLARSAQAAGAWRPDDGKLIPALDARRGEVYACAYTPDALASIERAGPVVALAEGVYTAQALAVALPGAGVVVGDGAEVIREALDDGSCGPVGWRCEPGVRPEAVQVGLAAWPRLVAGEGVAARDLVPRYVRRAEAEVTLRGERFE